MDVYEKTGYLCLGFVAVIYVVAMLVGVIAAFPFGLILLVAIVGEETEDEGAMYRWSRVCRQHLLALAAGERT